MTTSVNLYIFSNHLSIYRLFILSGSPADSMGLQQDDVILRINGIHVAYTQADTVAGIVR